MAIFDGSSADDFSISEDAPLAALVQADVLLDGFSISSYASDFDVFFALLTSGVTVSHDEVLVLEIIQIIEAISLASTFDHAGSIFRSEITEDVSVAALLLFTWDIINQEGFTVSDTSTPPTTLLLLINSIAETLYVAGIVPNKLIAIELVSSSILIGESLERFFEGTATDEFTVDDTNVVWAAFKSLVDAALTIHDNDLSATAILSLITSDTTDIGDSTDINQVLRSAILEGLSLSISFTEDDETYTGWVMNTDSFAVSNYVNYNFNSMCRFNGSYFGASAFGVYQLTGENDAGVDIAAVIKTGVRNFGTHHLKRMTTAYIGMRANGNMVFKTITHDKERWYEMKPATSAQGATRVKLGRGVKSVYWQFELINKDGSDFEIDDIELLPVILSRKV